MRDPIDSKAASSGRLIAYRVGERFIQRVIWPITAWRDLVITVEEDHLLARIDEREDGGRDHSE
jgi:hypothetical protein